MLVLTRKIGEEIVIGTDIRIMVVAIKGEKVRIGITAPKDVIVDRQEIHENRNNALSEVAPLTSTMSLSDDLLLNCRVDRPTRITDKEIDILLEANSNGCLIVEKDSQALWEQNELLEAQEEGLYQEKGLPLSPEQQTEVSGPFPGCVPGGSGVNQTYRLLGQTKHFVIFFPAEGPVPALGIESH